MTNAFQWIQYAIINNIVARYWDVSAATIDWLSLIYMVVYVPLIFPATWLIDKKVRKEPCEGTTYVTNVGASPEKDPGI